MYNTDMPTRAELPSSRQLIRSTIIAILAAAAILVTIVLPAEYGIDPTGIGRALSLAEMGEIKQQLAREAEDDRRRDQQILLDRRSSLGSAVASLFISSARAQIAARTEEMSVTLKPGQGAEIKLVMKKDAKASYSWSSTGNVNYDLHAEGGGKTTSYKKGRNETKDEGSFTAAFDGDHGWFWRNRTSADVTVTVKATGDFSGMKRLM
ncbi:transmembrane anchor protein [Ferrovibrio sp.]|uniref:transmembrane anchor protein n=1 Tax=Ferrovibrio sp. TaxID=1917215 RepID=UPI003516178B